MQALAGGAARVGGREGAAAATEGTAMRCSPGAAVWTPGPPRAFARSPGQQGTHACWGPSVLNPLLACWRWEEGRERASPAAGSRGSEGTEQHPSQGNTPAPTPGPPLVPARATGHEGGAEPPPRPCP